MITKFEPDVYYNLDEIVQRTGKNVQTFRRWIHSGKIKGQKAGREYLVPGIELNNAFGINTK